MNAACLDLALRREKFCRLLTDDLPLPFEKLRQTNLREPIVLAQLRIHPTQEPTDTLRRTIGTLIGTQLPRAAGALILPQRMHSIDAILLRTRRMEHGRRKEIHRPRTGTCDTVRKEIADAMLLVVFFDTRKNAENDGICFRRMCTIEFGALQTIRGKRTDCRHDLLWRMLLLMQHHIDSIILSALLDCPVMLLQQRRAEPVVNDECTLPILEVAQNLRIQSTIALTEGMQALIGVHRRCAANECQKFIDVERRVGHPPPLHCPAPHLRPPSKIPTQLGIGERIIRREILIDRPPIVIVVLVVRHETCLLEKKLGAGLPEVRRGFDERAHGTEQLRRFLRRRLRRDRLISIEIPPRTPAVCKPPLPYHIAPSSRSCVRIYLFIVLRISEKARIVRKENTPPAGQRKTLFDREKEM